MLLELLRNERSISKFLDVHCSENDVSVKIDEGIDPNDLLIIKVDKYYNSLVHKPGASPDCLVLQRCSNNRFKIFIIELKNIDGPEGFKIENVKLKFINCLDDFMSIRFGNYFHNNLFEFLEIRLLFISDPYAFLQSPEKQLRMRGHKIDALIAQRIPRYFNQYLFIEHKLPNPTIKKCK